MTAGPILWTWDGDNMVPRPRFKETCDKHLVVGEVYRLIPQEMRSKQSHDHFFASVAEAWKNLPEDVAARFATPDHLRKRALVDAGYYHEEFLILATHEDAVRAAAFVQSLDDFAVISVNNNMVVRRTAKSQSTRAMDNKEFQASKTAVLDMLSTMIGVSRGALEKHAGAKTGAT